MKRTSDAGHHTACIVQNGPTYLRGIVRQPSLTSIAALALALSMGSVAAMGQAPDWQVVNPAAFDASMAATAIVFVDGSPAMHPDNLVAAFSGTEVRGVSKPSFVGGDQLFFLTTFGNIEGETLSFKIYDAAVDAVRDINESIDFASNAALGELDRPMMLSAGSPGTNRPTWEVTGPGSFEQSMSVTTSAVLDGIPATHPGNMVAAFVGSEIRAVASPVWVTGRQVFFLNVLGNSNGELVTFRIYDAMSGQVRSAAEMQAFEAGSSLGSVAEPYLLTDGTGGANRPAWEVADAGAFETTMSIASTVYVNGMPSSNPGNLLASFAGAELRGVALPRMVNGVQTFFLTVFGEPATGALTFQFYDAAGDRVLTANDQIAFASDEAIGSVQSPLVLTIGPPPANAPGWSVNPADYEASMSVVATLFIDGLPSSSPNSLIAAFRGATVRGVASPTLVNGVMLYYLTIFGNADGEDLTFRAFDAGEERVRLVRETLPFRTNASVGETKVPLVLNTVKEAVDIAVSKSVDNTNPTVGSDVEFVVTVTNVGAQQATGVIITDTVPDGMTFTGTDASQGSYSAVSGTWTVGGLDSEQSATLTVTATVNQAGSITNTASLTSVDQPDTNPGNDVVSITVGGEQADLQVTKTVSTGSANVGSQVTFVATVRNNGPSAATGITVSDQMSSGLRIDSATPSQGTFNLSTATWSAGSLTSGAEATITVVATVLASGSQTNTATIASSGTADPNAANNSATASVVGEQVDIVVTKTVDNGRPALGETVQFTIAVANDGPSDATGLTVVDAAPDGLVFTGTNASSGSYDGGTGIWTIGGLAAGASETLTIAARVDRISPIANTARLQSVDQPDSEPANNKSTASIAGQQADLAVSKSVSESTPNVGSEVVFTITLENRGPLDATGITVNDAAPAGLTFGTVTATAGSYDALSGVWTVPDLVNRGSAELHVTATVDSAGVSANTATITGSDQPDTNTSNDSATSTVDGQLVDLSLTKAVDRPSVAPGDSVWFTITLRNDGPSAASGIEVTDILPAGLQLVDSVPSSGAFDASAGLWSIRELAAGTEETLQLRTRVVSSGAFTNTVSISGVDQPDGNGANDTAEVTVSTEPVDLAVSKVVDDSAPQVGSRVVFTIVLINNGGIAATGIRVRDVAPEGLAFSAHSATAGSFDPGTGVWTITSLDAGGQATLSVTSLVTRAGQITNTADIIHIDQQDSDTSNNESMATLNAVPGESLSGIVQNVVFDGNNTDSVLQNPPLVSATVEILVGGEVVERTTTDPTGVFSIPIAGAQDRVIRITAAGTVPETDEQVVVVKELPVTDVSRIYIIPLGVAVQKHSLIYQLENLLIPSSVLAGGGDPLPLVVSYDESGARTLMQGWLVNVGPERDLIIEGIARLIFSELVLSDLYPDAVQMSHETADVLFQLVRAFLITQQIADDIRNGATQQLLDELRIRVIQECFEQLRRLIKEVFIDAPLEGAIGKLPTKCGPLLARVLRAIIDEANTVSLVENAEDVAVFDEVITAGDQELLGWYVDGTQPDLDRSVDRAGRFDTPGSADEAYEATRTVVGASSQTTASVQLEARALQARANLDEIMTLVMRHGRRPRRLGNLAALYKNLKNKQLAFLGLSIGRTTDQLKAIEAVDIPAGTTAAFDAAVPELSYAQGGLTAASSSRIAGTDAQPSNRPAAGTATGSRAAAGRISTSHPKASATSSVGAVGVPTGKTLSTTQFREAIAEIAQLATEGRKAEAIAKYDPIVGLEIELTRSLRLAQAPVIAAAQNAPTSVTDFDDKLANMVDAVTESSVDRAIFYAQLLEYAGDPAFSVDSLSAQVDSINITLDRAEARVSDLATETSGVVGRPYVAVVVIDVDEDQVNLGDTLHVSAVIQNLGSLAADSVVVTLLTDASAEVATQQSRSLGVLQAQQEQTAAWSLQVVDTTAALGTFQVLLESSNALTSSSAGSYSFTPSGTVGIQPLPTGTATDLALFQSYPNPFTTNTTFSVANPEFQRVTLRIFDLVGRQVSVVVNETLPAGLFTIPFRADNLASGVYLVRLEAGGRVLSRKMTLVR